MQVFKKERENIFPFRFGLKCCVVWTPTETDGQTVRNWETLTARGNPTTMPTSLPVLLTQVIDGMGK